jgi:copper resistance protein D
VVWLHVLAAIAWIGGMIFISLVLSPVLRQRPDFPRGEILQSVGTAMKAIGWIAILILLFTGLLNFIHLQIQWNTFIGRLLILKLILVALVVGLSAVHDFLLGPKLAARLRHSSSPVRSVPAHEPWVRWIARINLSLALAIIYLAVLIARS